MDVVVTGGGLAGLATALFLGRAGHRVTLLERDDAWRGSDPQDAFEEWARGGVPQARQPHNFLARSVRILRAEVPEVLETLLDHGVLRLDVDLGDGPGDFMLCARRLVYEHIVRGIVEKEPGVTIRSGVTVTGLTVEPGDVPVIRSIATGDGEIVRGDCFVDAAGRRSPFPALLESAGVRPINTTAQECGLMYISRYYRLRDGEDYPAYVSPVMNPLDWAAGIAFPSDNRTFALLASVAAIDPLRRRLIDNDAFTSFHDALPLMKPWLNAGEPLSKIRTMTRLENRYQRLVDNEGPIVGGMVFIGDSALHTNPTAGRGVSLAFAQAQHFAKTAADAPDAATLVSRFDEWTQANIGAWFLVQAGADSALSHRLEAAVRGKPAPPPDAMEQLRGALFGLAGTDSEAGARIRRVAHLVDFPHQVFADATIRAEIEAFAQNAPGQQPAGPTRDDFIASLEESPKANIHT
ncbi:MAG: FAD-dependent oxidoreductase [Actinomycetota bacterium]